MTTVESITSGQEKQIIRVCEDAARKAAEEALAEAALTKDLSQHILAAGDKLQAKLKDVVVQFICAMSITLREGEERVTKATTIWKKITLGAHASVQTLSDALAAGGFKIGDYAKQIMAKVKLNVVVKELNLVVISVAELGFTDSTTFDQIIKRAKELGLELCPAEVGPASRLAYRDQPKDEWLLIAMEPIPVSDGYLHVFYVVHDDIGLWLNTLWFDPQGVWLGYYRWVFCRK